MSTGGPGPSLSLIPMGLAPGRSCPVSHTKSHSTTHPSNERPTTSRAVKVEKHISSLQAARMQQCCFLEGRATGLGWLCGHLSEVPWLMGRHCFSPHLLWSFYFSFFVGKALCHCEQGFKGPGTLIVCQVARIWLSLS